MIVPITFKELFQPVTHPPSLARQQPGDLGPDFLRVRADEGPERPPDWSVQHVKQLVVPETAKP
jgi:hypothetical protein